MVQVSRLTGKTLELVRQAWYALTEWHSADEFLDRILPIINGAQVQTAALTDAYLAALISEATGQFTAPIGLAAEQVTDLRRNTTMAAAYERPFPPSGISSPLGLSSRRPSA